MADYNQWDTNETEQSEGADMKKPGNRSKLCIHLKYSHHPKTSFFECYVFKNNPNQFIMLKYPVSFNTQNN